MISMFCQRNKIKHNKYHAVWTVLQFNSNIVEIHLISFWYLHSFLWHTKRPQKMGVTSIIKKRYNIYDKELFDGYLSEIICTWNAKS